MLVSPTGILLDRKFHRCGSGRRNVKTSEIDGSGQNAVDDSCNKKGEEMDEDYESAIYIGNDLSIQGDEDYNGFSARGWNPVMANMALRRCLKTLE
jgi:hypothetical protein